MLNAGCVVKQVLGKTFWQDRDPETFQETLVANPFSYANGLATFTNSVMSGTQKPRMIVLTGSKQGVTTPPGDPAYNASKSAVKTIAEHLPSTSIPATPT